MDNLFQYLIWGIIIFSFLSSFFKKKGQPKPPLQGTKPGGNTSYQAVQKPIDLASVTKKQDQYDILHELENMFKGNIKIPEEPKTKQIDSYDIYASREIKDKDLNLQVDKRLQRNVQDQSPIGSRPTYDEGKSQGRKSVLQKQSRKVDAKIEAGAKEFEKVLAGPQKQRAAVADFNRKLKNPSTVKEYILFSEILGKPKAMRR
ncbi:MAG: hypothetical protein ABI638_10940 [Ignavibacteriota bacterium]